MFKKIGVATLSCILLLFAASRVSATNQSASSNFPLDVETIKIEVNADGIYRLSYADLQAAGMAVDDVNPATFEMMWQGESVAYQFVGDGDTLFEAGESVLFYGWAFDGSRLEKQYFNNNVFWLWAGGAASTIQTVASESGLAQVVDFSAELTTEPELTFTLTKSRYWDLFPNEYDSFYWRSIRKSDSDPITTTVTINLPDPVPQGDAHILVETLDDSRINGHSLQLALNNETIGSYRWHGRVNQNLEGNVSQTTLQNGANELAIHLQTPARDHILLNRVTVTYQRALKVINDELAFGHMIAGEHEFVIDGISENDPTNVLLWELSDRQQPLAITLDAPINGRYHAGVSHTVDAQFFVTTQANIRQPVALSRYIGQSLEPVDDGAQWVAIAYGDFVAQTEQLAAHRQTHSRLTTHVVDVQDVINQYGYGLPTPYGIQDYLRHATTNWAVAPEYVMLVGDATVNPRQLSCTYLCPETWTDSDLNYVPTFLEPVDRFLGMAPVDHFYSMLTGDDDVPDVALGRLPVKNSAELQNLINKIITYENNLTAPQSWMENMLFISDDADSAGNFCNHNAILASTWGSQFTKMQRCLDEHPFNTIRKDLFEQINNGVLLVQYSGHGHITGWAGEGILDVLDTPHFTNADKPYVQISGNCLDGHFAWTGLESISETLLALEGGGSAAHWGATGLGYLSEHSVLHKAFYQAVQEEGLTRIGDAIKFAKEQYLDTYHYRPQAYSSTLLGDPAMQLMHPAIKAEQTVTAETIQVGEIFDIVITLHNEGLLSTGMTITHTLSENVLVHQVSVAQDHAVAEDRTATTNTDVQSVVTLKPIAWGESATVTVRAQVIRSAEQIDTITSQLEIDTGHFQANVNDSSLETSFQIEPVDPTTITLRQQSTQRQIQPTILLTAILFTILTFVITAKTR